MLNYSIAMLKNPLKPEEEAKAYAKSQIAGELSLKELSKRVARQTTVSRADVSAVIIATVENMIDGLQVDFGDLGKFRLQISSRGAETAEKFTSAHITGVNIQFIPGEDLKELFDGLEFVPVPTRAATRALLKAQKAGQTTVDISSKTLSGHEGDADPSNDGGSTGAGHEGSAGGSGNQNENPLG